MPRRRRLGGKRGKILGVICAAPSYAAIFVPGKPLDCPSRTSRSQQGGGKSEIKGVSEVVRLRTPRHLHRPSLSVSKLFVKILVAHVSLCTNIFQICDPSYEWI